MSRALVLLALIAAYPVFGGNAAKAVGLGLTSRIVPLLFFVELRQGISPILFQG